MRALAMGHASLVRHGVSASVCPVALGLGVRFPNMLKSQGSIGGWWNRLDSHAQSTLAGTWSSTGGFTRAIASSICGRSRTVVASLLVARSNHWGRGLAILVCPAKRIHHHVLHGAHRYFDFLCYKAMAPGPLFEHLALRAHI